MLWKPEHIKNYLQVDKRDWYTFISALVCGLMAHMYMFTNKLPNYDDVLATFDGCGSSYVLGRWGLGLIHELRVLLIGNMSMPWLNGMFTLLMLALSSVLVVRILSIEDKGYAMLAGGILVVFPSVVSLMFFMFTAPYYSIAVLAGTVGVYCMEKKKYGWMNGLLLFCFSISIYQAYLSWIAGLLILVLIRRSLEKTESFGSILKKSFQYAGILLASLVLYLALNHMILSWKGISMSDYQGLSSIGAKKLGDILQSIRQIYFLYFDFRIHEYAGITTSKLLRLILCGCLLADFITIIMYVCRGKRTKADWWKDAATLILLLLFPMAVFAIYLVANENTRIYTLMLYSVSLILIAPILLAEKMECGTGNLIRKIRSFFNVAIFAGMIASIYIFVHIANEHYTWMQIDYERSYSYLTTVITQIKEVDGYSEDYPVAFLIRRGQINDPTLNHSEYEYLDITIEGIADIVNMYSMDEFIRCYCGYQYTAATEEEIMARKEQIQSMPLYPEDGSVQVIDGVVVVKFQELQ